MALSDGGKTSFRIRTAGRVIEVRTTDSALADTLFRYIAVPEAEADAVPDAVFHYWRDDCARFAPPEAPEKEAKSLESYVKTKFFRFLVLLKKNTQNAARGVYSYVPVQDYNTIWTDEILYEKYKLTGEEIAFIESLVRPME